MSKPPGTRDGAKRDLAAMLVVVEQLKPALEKNDREGQVGAVRRLVDLRAPMGEQWQALANLAVRNGELQLGRRAIDLFVDARAGAAEALYAKASLLEQCGAYREAYDLVRSLPDGALDPAAHAYSRGTAALYLGEMQDAREQLELAVRLRPHRGRPWLVLAQAVDLAAEPELAETIVAAQRVMETVAPAERAPYFFALGQALAARNDHAGAFAAFKRGNEDTKPLAPYDRERDRSDAEEALSGFTAEGIAALAERRDRPTGRAMFVTGLPRSGTTLVQQILSRHSAVDGGGELTLLVQLARQMRGRDLAAIEQHLAASGAGDIARLWAHLLGQRFSGSGRVVDKSLDFSRFAGIAAALLPEAPIVWLTRDPLDRAWSCFRTHFHGAQPWSCDLADIAWHFRLEEELRRRWQDLLGERLLTVPYESLVSQPAEWVSRIAAHCGLAMEPQMLAPHEGGGLVTTASVMQVRRPLNRAGIGSAEPYREYLAPFVEAYPP